MGRYGVRGRSRSSPNRRYEVHYDEDFHSSTMIVPSALMSRSGLPVKPSRRTEVSVTGRAKPSFRRLGRDVPHAPTPGQHQPQESQHRRHGEPLGLLAW